MRINVLMAVADSHESAFYFHSVLLVWNLPSSSVLFQPPPTPSLPFHLAIFIFLPFIIYYPHCFIWYIYLPDLSSFRLFQPFHIFALLAFTIHSPYFYGYTGAPRIQLFPFLLPTRATDAVPLVKTFFDPGSRDFGSLLVMQSCSRLTWNNKLIG